MALNRFVAGELWDETKRATGRLLRAVEPLDDKCLVVLNEQAVRLHEFCSCQDFEEEAHFVIFAVRVKKSKGGK
jgi:hypothetical protein